MKKSLRNKIATILSLSVIILPVTMTGCVTTGQPQNTKTAVEKIMEESNDPVKIAQAAQLEALYRYNNLGERYLKYQPYLMAKRPKVHNQVIDILGKMDNLLNKWEEYAALGAVPKEIPDTFEGYLTMVLDLLLALDEAGVEI